MSWRFIPFQRYDPYFKTALNEVLMDTVRDGGDPVFFLAGWDRRCVNIGRSQDLEKRCNTEFCEEDGVAIVRRQGGGGATYLTPEGELTWGVIDASTGFSDDVNEIYEEWCGRVAEALETLGVEARHEPVNDVVTLNGKISGATLKRNQGVTYVGGTLLLEVDAEEMFRYLNPDPEKNERHGVEDFRERVTSMEEECDAGSGDAREALKQAFLSGKDHREDELTKQERTEAEERAGEYRSNSWIRNAEV